MANVSFLIDIGLKWLHTGWIPDFIVRWVIRRLCESRKRELMTNNVETSYEYLNGFIQKLRQSPIAILSHKANEQHYELAPKFFQLVLGKHLKYSACYFPNPYSSLDEAEQYTLDLYMERAQIADGQVILDLGCGWGSFTLYVAEKYPNCAIVSLTNSSLQQEYIQNVCRQKGYHHIQVIQADINEWDNPQRFSFDRVVSVEMFEHMKNYELLLNKIATWLKPNGYLFLHIFCHRQFPYSFESEGSQNWMGKYFFSGGTMPSAFLLLYFQESLQVVKQWVMNGKHYAQTSECWLYHMDKNQTEIMKVFYQIYGKDACHWFQYWRIFWMACAELFGYDNGNEWFVTHLLWKRNKYFSPQ